MQVHDLKRKNPNKKSVQVGRGGKRGKTAGRGTKGQKARAGHRIRPEIRDMIKKLPKMRGRGKNSNKSYAQSARTISLDVLEATFKDGDRVTPASLLAAGLVGKVSGKIQNVKILSTGSLKKKLTIKNCAVSKTAKELIEKAGGKVA